MATIHPFLARLNARTTFLTLTTFTILAWTLAHINFKYLPATPDHPKQRLSIFSPPPHATTHNPSYTEIAKAPLKIYIPPAKDVTKGASDDVLDANWVSTSQNDATFPKDTEAYQKALKCPVCPVAKECPSWKTVLEEAGCSEKSDSKDKDKAASSNSSPTPGSRPVISYIYTESALARKNLAFFINHALHDAADFAFLLYGDTKVDIDIIPKTRGNVFILKRALSKKSCNPMATHIENLSRSSNKKQLYKDKKLEAAGKGDPNTFFTHTHERFILMDSSMRGPFMPRWSAPSTCWTNAFLTQLAPKTKLISTHLQCHNSHRPHLHPHLLGTDRSGLEKLIADKRTSGATSCFFLTDEKAILNVTRTVERDISEVIRENGWEAEVLDLSWRDVTEYRYAKCTGDEGRYVPPSSGVVSVEGETVTTTFVDGAKEGKDGKGEGLDPWEMMWVSVESESAEKEVEGLSRKVGRSQYSSYEACRRK